MPYKPTGRPPGRPRKQPVPTPEQTAEFDAAYNALADDMARTVRVVPPKQRKRARSQFRALAERLNPHGFVQVLGSRKRRRVPSSQNRIA